MDFLKEVEKHLDLPTIKKAEVLKELTAHCAELKEELTTSGLSAGQMDEEIIQRMGKPQEVAARISATHCSTSWKTALLCVVPFVVSMIISLLGSIHSLIPAKVITVCAGLVFIAFSIREFKRDRRPIWLAVWYAGSLKAAMGAFLIFKLYPVYSSHYVLTLSISIIALLTLVWKQRICIGTIIFGALGACMSLYLLKYAIIDGQITNMNVPIMMVLSPLIYSIVLMFYSKLIFQSHRYGSGAQASLFMLSLLGLPFMLYYRFPNSTMVYITQGIGILACAISVVWFVHAPKHTTKTLALATAIICLILQIGMQQFYVVSGIDALHTHIARELIAMAVMNTIYHSFIFIPLLSEYKKQPNRRQLA